MVDEVDDSPRLLDGGLGSPQFMDAPPAAAPLPTAAPLSPAVSPASPISLQLERRGSRQSRSSSGPLDWASLVLAILVAPLGLIVAIVALVVGSRSRGWTSVVPKIAIGIAIVLSAAGAGGLFLYENVAQKQAAHDAVVASSASWCTDLRSVPDRLSSPTFGWPPLGSTVDDSIPAMQTYVTQWKKLVAEAPSGIRQGTQRVETAAQSIVRNATENGVVDDSSNQATMTAAVQSSGIASYVSQYCR